MTWAHSWILLTRVKAKPSVARNGPNKHNTACFSLSRLLLVSNHPPRKISAKFRDFTVHTVGIKMEENFRPDLATAGSCRNELTRSNSDTSVFTVEESKHVLNHNENARPDECMIWTDEKHRLYLNSLESSFVNQLHRSMGLLARCSGQHMDPSSYMQLPANIRNSSDQFMVLRDGCWQKISFKRSRPLSDTAADSHVILDSPWIHHFKCASKGRTIASADLQQHSTLSSERMPQRGMRAFPHRFVTSLEELPICHSFRQHSVGSITEVSDQNFVNGDREEISSTLSLTKRLKMAAADSSSKDQIVPSGNFHRTEISTSPNASPERETNM